MAEMYFAFGVIPTIFVMVVTVAVWLATAISGFYCFYQGTKLSLYLTKTKNQKWLYYITGITSPLSFFFPPIAIWQSIKFWWSGEKNIKNKTILSFHKKMKNSLRIAIVCAVLFVIIVISLISIADYLGIE